MSFQMLDPRASPLANMKVSIRKSKAWFHFASRCDGKIQRCHGAKRRIRGKATPHCKKASKTRGYKSKKMEEDRMPPSGLLILSWQLNETPRCHTNPPSLIDWKIISKPRLEFDQSVEHPHQHIHNQASYSSGPSPVVPSGYNATGMHMEGQSCKAYICKG